MINLIGPDRKKRILAARRNSIWARYNLLILSVIVAVNIILLAALYITYLDQISFDVEISNVKKEQNEEYTNRVLQETKSFREDIDAAKTLLDANVSYSDMIATITNAIPKNCRIDTLSVGANTYKNESQKINFTCDKPNNTTDYAIVSELLTNLEKSLVYHSIYIEKTGPVPEKKNLLLISTSLKTQDPATKIPKAIPDNCKLRTINTLGQTPFNANTKHPKYLVLACRAVNNPSDKFKVASISRDELRQKVLKTVQESCYFTGLNEEEESYKSYDDSYYVANYTYSFSDITFRQKQELKNGAFIRCQKI
ncbi:hypothetical protein HY004_01830 [Candidatus Saccharibacteria bacterium]|nr:hypothetical protein [Candidatus Saccharibacteria bacterium]